MIWFVQISFCGADTTIHIMTYLKHFNRHCKARSCIWPQPNDPDFDLSMLDLFGIYRTEVTWRDQNLGRKVEVIYMDEQCLLNRATKYCGLTCKISKDIAFLIISVTIIFHKPETLLWWQTVWWWQRRLRVTAWRLQTPLSSMAYMLPQCHIALFLGCCFPHLLS